MTEKNNNYEARITKKVGAPASEVWDALTSPEKIKRYMFGTIVETDWKPGSKILWEGEWNGKSFRDEGTVLEAESGRHLRYSHFSPGVQHEDTSDNYHIVDIVLAGEGDGTVIELTQDNNRSPEAQKHSEENWSQMLDGLKEVVED